MGSSTDKQIITTMGNIMDKLDAIAKRLDQIEAAHSEGIADKKPKKPKKKYPKPDTDENECILFHWVKKDGTRGSDANYLKCSSHAKFKLFLKGLNLKWSLKARGYELPEDLTVSKLQAEIAEAWPDWSFQDIRTDKGDQSEAPSPKHEDSDSDSDSDSD